MFSLFKRKPPQFFSAEEQGKVVAAIQTAEQRTSGEVRVYVESRCRFVDPIDRAAEIFYDLQMQKTALRNGVLVYVAMKDRQLAVFADENIYKVAGADFWKQAVLKMLGAFNKDDYAQGIAAVVLEIGAALEQYFPYDGVTDKNELPDEMVFGK
jgi:uncharacterized membrane protein